MFDLLYWVGAEGWEAGRAWSSSLYKDRKPCNFFCFLLYLIFWSLLNPSFRIADINMPKITSSKQSVQWKKHEGIDFSSSKVSELESRLMNP